MGTLKYIDKYAGCLIYLGGGTSTPLFATIACPRLGIYDTNIGAIIELFFPCLYIILTDMGPFFYKLFYNSSVENIFCKSFSEKNVSLGPRLIILFLLFVDLNETDDQ